MKNVNHNDNVSGNGVRESHLAKKEELRIQKSSFLRFSVSLMLSLFLVYIVFQVQAEVSTEEVADVTPIEDKEIYFMEDFRVEQKVVEQPKPEPKIETKIIYDKVDAVDNDTDIKSEVIDTKQQEVEVTSLTNTDNVEVMDDDEEPETLPFIMIEDAPVFPGCEEYRSSKSKLKKCMSEKIQKHVNRKFNTDLADDLGLQEGRKRITVLFTIDENGKITDIQSKGPHPKLEKEAERVVNLLPVMEPGKQRNKTVKVKYTLPIVFTVR